MRKVIDYIVSRLLGVTILRAEARISKDRMARVLVGNETAAERATRQEWMGR